MYCENLIDLIKPFASSEIITTGKNPFSNFALVNFRHFNKYLYPLEVVVNIIILLKKHFFLKIKKPRLFHVHGAANLAPIIVARMLKIPIIWHFHETFDEWKFIVNLGNFILKGGNFKLASVSHKAIEQYSLKKTLILSPPINSGFWKINNKNKIDRCKNKKVKFLVVANLSPIKGIEFLLEALNNINEDWTLDIIGMELPTHKNYSKKLKKLAFNLNKINERVKFLGFKDKVYIKKHFEKTNIFILPSKSEATPISLLEAMSMECLCIATKVGDVSRMIVNNKTGFLVEKSSSNSLEQKIRKVLSLSNKKKLDIGLKARNSIISNYSQKKILDNHLELYNSFLSKN